MRILLVNQGKSGENLGDRAIAETFRKVLNDKECIVDIAGFSETKSQSIPEIDIKGKTINLKYIIKKRVKKAIPSLLIWIIKYRKKIKQEFKNLRNTQYDLVIIGGGQLIKSKSVFPYALLTWYNIVRKNLSCPIIVAGVGTDVEFSAFEKMIYKKVLTGLDGIFARDFSSQKIIQECFKVKCKYMPDIAFAESRYITDLLDFKDRRIFLVMIFSYDSYIKNSKRLVNKEEYYKTWLGLINDNSDKELEIVLSYTTTSDKIETYEFARYLEKYGDFKFYIGKTDNLEEYSNLLMQTKQILSGRMHAMILGLNYNCKVIPFIVNPKLEIFKKEWINIEYDKKAINNIIDESINEILKR
jgi:polysaccharide pyruvyl transferase WcaK-like protein